MSRVTLILLLSALPLSCNNYDNARPVLGYEYSDMDCSDGFDNDEDGFIDCMDPDCLMLSTHCNAYVPTDEYLEPEDTYELCRDNIDNDDDGNFDCGDRKCQVIQELCCSREFTNEACSDGIDNDFNNFADCADFGCSQGMFVTACDDQKRALGRLPPKPPIGPSLLEIKARGLSPKQAAEESSLAMCTDGQDNDNDGYTDCGDYSCSDASKGASAEAVAHCDSLKETTRAQCSNGVDEDGNGFTDCEDFSCTRANNGATQEAIDYCDSIAENTAEKCSNGVDDDGNGHADCNDWSCTSASNGAKPDAIAYCKEVMEADFYKCTDGIDNDGNGYGDCADYSCSRADDLATKMACQESSPAVTPESNCTDPCRADCVDGACGYYCTSGGKKVICKDTCADGIDNDLDSFVDCLDWDCSYNPAKSLICPGLGVCEIK
ncbi:hypothetical protein KKF91_14435 [Myxococcota bacterium]|nr:hypothetical protein [Myxococcota bacterium]MBU1431739.1 hypothetical protein [Myxococcota bacterium]MBU1900373.1 hypothetical protein [Myxococcota bacterium]